VLQKSESKPSTQGSAKSKTESSEPKPFKSAFSSNYQITSEETSGESKPLTNKQVAVKKKISRSSVFKTKYSFAAEVAKANQL
jgi:hypothetical protein